MLHTSSTKSTDDSDSILRWESNARVAGNKEFHQKLPVSGEILVATIFSKLISYLEASEWAVKFFIRIELILIQKYKLSNLGKLSVISAIFES